MVEKMKLVPYLTKPILPLIYINDMPFMLVNVILFADNANLFSKINNVSSNGVL